MPIGIANIHIQFNVSEFINKHVSFLFCEFNRVTSWKEGKNGILERSSSLIPQRKYLFHFQGLRMSMWTCLFLIVILKETLVLMCLASHFDIIETCKWRLDIATYIIQKNIKFLIRVELRILCKKWNMYEAHIFPRPLQQTCRLETTPLFLNTRLCVNRKFQYSQNVYWN